MKRWMKVLAAFVAVVAVAFVALRVLRGPSGASSAYGGSIDAAVAPEFPSVEAGSWANGAATPLASLRGSPVLLEIWSPS